MNYKLNKITDLVSLSEAAKIRGCSHQAISELVKKGRFTIYDISRRTYLSKKEVASYTSAATGRPKKQKTKKVRGKK